MLCIFRRKLPLTPILFVVLYLSSRASSSRFCDGSQKDNVSYLANIIAEAEKNGLTYQLPTDARQYTADADTKTDTDYGTFDFIVVGAGSGGTVVANRLTEITQWKVLLLEAGDYGDCLTNIPNMYFPVEFTKYNWGFYSTPQNTSCLGMVDKKCPLPRGKGIGGSTLINGMVYARGSSIDFDRWANHVNDSQWSYKEVRKYFKKSENFTHRDKAAPVTDSVHGEGGYLHVEYHLPRSPQLNRFLEANEELGLPVTDYNAGTGLGASNAQINSKDGRRYDDGKAFIRPVLHRKNLVVLPNSYVKKVLIHNDNKTAYGIAFNHKNKSYTATVNKEVILSAGSIGTPHILMLSGIGPKGHLEAVNIPLIHDLEVGSALKDHPMFLGWTFTTNYTEPVEPLKDYVEKFVKGYGPLAAAANIQGVGFYESQFTKGTGLPDIEIILFTSNGTTNLSQRAYGLTDTTYEDIWKNTNPTQTMNMFVVALHTASTGTVRLKNNDPLEYPLVDTNFLSDPQNKDIRTMYEGVQLVLKLSRTHALQKIQTTLQGGPLRACKQHLYLSEEYWYCAIRQVTMDVYHPVSTCPMGRFPEKGDVVNSKLQVHGVKGLRIADASVFPFTLAGHPNAPVVMVGEVLSDIVKKNYLP